MDPLSDKWKEASQPSDVKGHNPPKEEDEDEVGPKIYEKPEIVLEKLKQGSYRDKEDEEDDVLSQLADKIAESKCPFPPGSPFADTDMVIFKDDYRGTLPRNAIKESELKKITETYDDIVKGRSKIRMVTKDDDFIKEMLLCIKTLLTREIGRKLIEKVIDLPDITIIKWGIKCKIKGNEIQMLTEMDDHLIGQHPSGKLASYSSGIFLALGHELIHRIHPKGYDHSQRKPTLGPEYDNLEDQITITGFKGSKKGSLEPKPSGVDWKPTIPKGYVEINEWNLTEAFTGSLTEYFSKEEIKRYPRVGHHAVPSGDVNINREKLESLITENVLFDLESLYKEGQLSKDTLAKFRPGYFHALAIQLGRPEALELLLKIDPNPQLKIPDDRSLLLVVAKNAQNLTNEKMLPMMNAIIAAGVDVNLADEYGNTAIHHFARLGNKEAIKTMIEKAREKHPEVLIKVNAKNNFGSTPLFALSTEMPDGLEIARLLIANGADIKDEAGNVAPIVKVYPELR